MPSLVRACALLVLLLAGIAIDAANNHASACPKVSRPFFVTSVDLVGDWTPERQLDISGTYVAPLVIEFSAKLVEFQTTPTGAFRMRSRGIVGVERVTVSVSDSTGCAPSKQLFYVIINNNNTRPAFATFPIEAIEDNPSPLYALDPIDPNPGPGGLSFEVSNVSTDQVTVEYADGHLRINPAPDYSGTGSFTGKLCDSYGTWNSCVAKTFYFSVVNTNDPPSLSPFSMATAPETPSAWYTPPVTDPDPRDTHSAAIVTSPPPSDGIAEVSDSRVRFVPAPGFIGTSSFELRVCDAAGACSDPVMASVTVGGVGFAPTFVPPSVTISEDSNTGWLGLAISDPDPADRHQASVSARPAHGRVDIDASNRVRYVPDPDWNGTDSFTVTVCDLVGNCVEGVADVVVQPRNDVPVASDVVVSTLRDTPSRWVAVPFHDPDAGDTHTLSVVTAPSVSEGRVEILGTEVRFLPAAGFVGETSVTLRVCDGQSQCAPAITLWVTVLPTSQPPDYAPLSIVTNEDTASPWTIVAIVDPDAGDTHTLSIPSHGPGISVQLDGGVRVRVVPDPGWSGASQFDLKVCDGSGLCVMRSNAVTVNPVNDPPLLSVSPISTAEGVPSPWVPVSVTDPDAGDTHTLEIVAGAPPDHGVAETSSLQLRFVPAGNWFGATSFSVRACDALGLCSSAKLVTVAVSDVADPPDYTPLAAITDEDVATPWMGLQITDPDGPGAHTVAVVSQPADGLVELDASNQVRFTPRPNFHGSVAFDLRVCDQSASCVTKANAVEVQPLNDPPTLAPLDLATLEDTPSAWLPMSLTDPDTGDAHTLEIVASAPADAGVGEVGTGNSVRFVPALNWTGASTFSVRACDGAGLCSAPALVSVSVAPGPDAPEFTPIALVGDEDTATPWQSLVIIDPDPADTHTVAVVAQPMGGSVEVNAANELRFVPVPDWSGTSLFDLRVCDSAGLCVVRSSSAVINPVNDTPALVLAPLAGIEDVPSPWTSVTVLDPDDGDTHTLQIISAAPPEEGLAEVNALDLRFVPAPDWSGLSAFSVQVCDAAGACSDSTLVTVSVAAASDPPDYVPLAIVTDEDVASEWSSLSISDPDGDPIQSVSVLAQPTSGTVEIDGANQVRFVPNANWNGTATFEMRVCDLTAQCVVHTNTAMVSPINDAPVVSTGVVSAIEDTPSAWTSVSLSDPDAGDSHTLELVAQPPATQGVVELSGLEVRFLPALDWSGDLTFSLRACDSAGLCSDPANFAVTVANAGDPPDFTPISIATDEDVTSPWVDVAISDADVSDTHIASVVAQPAGGFVEINAANQVRFVPDPNWFGALSFELRICDTDALCATRTNTVEVAPVNDPPELAVGPVSTAEDVPSPWSSVTVTDPDQGDSHSLEIVSTAPAAAGVAEVNGLQLRFYPAPDWFGSTTLSLRACDSAGACSVPQVVTVEVASSGDPPDFTPLSLSTSEDVATPWTSLAISDPDAGDTHTVAVLVQPLGGLVEVDASHQVRFLPDGDFNGSVSFDLRVCDADSLCVTRPNTVLVEPANDPPALAAGSLNTVEDQPSAWQALVVNDPDAPDTHIIEIVTAPAPEFGVAELDALNLRFVPAPNWAGATELSLRACDSAGACSDPVTVSIAVASAGDPPAFTPVAFVTDEDTPSPWLDLAVTDDDLGDSHTVSVGAPPLGGILEVDGNNQVRFVPDPDWNGASSVTLRVCDAQGLCAQEANAITVNAINDAPVLAAASIATSEDFPSAWVSLVVNDPDGSDTHVLEVIAAPPAAAGTLETDALEVRFLPALDWSGETSVALRACDSASLCSAPLDLPITVGPVGDAPDYAALSLNTDEDTPSAWTALSISDADLGDTHSVSVPAQPLFGVLEVNAANEVRFVPAMDWHGSASVSIRVCDSSGLCAEKPNAVAVAPVNDPPSIVVNDIATLEDAPSAWVAVSVTDPDVGDVHALEVVSAPDSTHGVFEQNGLELRFVPAPDWFGATSGSLRVCDAGGQCSDVTMVSVTVANASDAPSFTPLALITDEDTPTPWTPLIITDPDAGESHSVSVTAQPATGTVLVDTVNQVRFVPAQDWSGETTFTIEVCDAAGNCVTDVNTVTVNAINDPPALSAIAISTIEDLPSAWTAFSVVDVDVGDSHTLELVAAPPASSGAIEFNSLHARFVPFQDFVGEASASVRVCDLLGECSAPVDVAVAVSAASDPPDVVALTLSTDEDVATPWTALAISDPDPGDTHVASVPMQPAGGVVEIDASTQVRFVPSNDWSGIALFDLLVCDSTSLCVSRASSVSVSPVNDVPAVAPLAIATLEDTPTPWSSLTISDPDPGDSHSVEIVAAPAPEQGSVEVDATQLRFLPASGFSGTAGFTLRVCDAAGLCSAPAPVEVVVSDVERAPDYTPFALVTDEDVSSPWVSLLITDADLGDVHTVEVVSQPVGGTLEISPANEVRFVPAANVHGQVSVDVRVCDQGGLCVTKTNTVSVSPINDAPSLEVADILTSEDAPSPWQPALVADADLGDTFSLQLVTNPPATHGLVEILDGTLRFVPAAGWFGTTAFVLRACDASSACSQSVTVGVSVTAINDPPQYAPLDALTEEDVPTAFLDLGIQDPDGGDTHSVTIVSQPEGGTVTPGAGNTVRVTPDENFSGTLAFDLRVCDSGGLCVTHTNRVEVSPVNDTPRFTPPSIVTVEDAASAWAQLAIIDPDPGDTHDVEISVAPDPLHGVVEVSADTLRFVPASSFTGATSFSVRVCDSFGACTADAAVAVSVLPVNDPPTFAPVLATIEEDHDTGWLDLSISDPDAGDTHRVAVVRQPLGGRVEVDGDNRVRFVPVADWHGDASFDLRVCDSAPLCVTLSNLVTVTPVNDPPTTAASSISTVEGVHSDWQRLTVVDPDIADTHSIEVTAAPLPSQGSVETDALELRFLPAVGYYGDTAFSVRVCDAGGLCSSPVAVSVAVAPIGHGPRFQPFAVAIDEDTETDWMDLAANDPDPGDVLSYTAAPVGDTGDILFDPQHRLRFIPKANFHGEAPINIRVCDTLDNCATETAVVTVRPINDVPQVGVLSFSGVEDAPSPWQPVPITDPDPGDSHRVEVVTAPDPAHGTAEIQGLKLRFVPAINWFGESSFAYRVCDAANACSPAIAASVSVAFVGDVPTFSPFMLSIDEDTDTGWIDLAIADGDPGDTHSVNVITPPNGGVLEVGSDNRVRFVATPNFNGVVSFNLRVCDTQKNCVVKANSVTVRPVNDLPVLEGFSIEAVENLASRWYKPLISDGDSRDTHRLEVVTPPANGDVVLNGLDLRFVPAPDWSGEVAFDLRVCDQLGGCSDPVSVSVSVLDSGSAPSFVPIEVTVEEDVDTGWVDLQITDPDAGDTHTVGVYGVPSKGAVYFDPQNRVRFAPPLNWSGTATFSLEVCDQMRNCVRAPNTVTVLPVNDVPEPRVPPIVTFEDSPSPWRTIDPRDPDASQTHSLRILSAPDAAYGALETRNLEVRFTPAPDWYGAAAFTFDVCDSAGACSPPVTGQISVTPVGDAPVVAPLSVSTIEDTPSAAITVAVTDVDIDDVHTLSIDQPIAEATLSATGLTFTLAPSADYAGSFTFGLRVCDLYNNCVVTQVPVTVSPVNDAPRVADLSLRAVQDTTTPWSVVEIEDPDQGDSHTLEIVSPPADGSLELNATALRYVPAAGWTGETAFSFRVCDASALCSDPAVGAIRVLDPNDPPVLEAFALETIEDSPSPWHTVVFADPDSYDSHTLTVIENSADGQVELRGLDVRFVPKQNFAGTAHFVIQLCDTEPHCVEHSVPVTVTPVNDAPALGALTLATTQEDLPTAWQRAQIADPDEGDSHTLEVSTSPGQGAVEVDADQVRYVPPAQWSGSDQFALRVCDAAGLCSPPVSVSVVVRPNNDAPNANGASLTTTEDVPSDWLELKTLVADPDDGDSYVISVVSQSPYGSAQVEGTRVRFTPTANYNGATNFSYQACDTVGACSVAAIIDVTVTPDNDRPTLGEFDLDTTEDLPTPWLSIPVVDPDEGDAHAFSVIAQAAGGRAEVLDSTLRFIPDPGWYGETQFTLEVCDIAGLCASRQYDVAVGFFNDPPSVEDVSIAIDEDTPSGPIALAVADPDPTDMHTITVVGTPLLGKVATVAQPLGFSYTPTPDANGQETFTVRVCDVAGLCAEANVSVEIRPVNDAPRSLKLGLLTKQDRATPFVVPTITDPDEGDTHTLSILTQPAGGAVELGSDGLSVRALPNPGFAGPDHFDVRVCDAQGACLDATADFSVIPSVSVDPALGAVRIPRVAVAVPLADARWPFTSERIKHVDTGKTITGVRDIRVEYSGDAIADLVMNGATLTRGDVITITDYDFTHTGGRIILPIALADPASASPGRIGTLRVYVPDFYATDVESEVFVWDPLEDIEIAASAGYFVRKVQQIALPARDSGYNCGSPIAVWTGPSSFAYTNRTRSYCAVEWTSLPNGVAQDTTKPSPLLRGYIDDAAPNVTFGWRAGLVYFNADGSPYFIPAPGEATLDVALVDPTAPTIGYEPVGQLASAVNWVADGEWPTNIGANVYAGVVRARSEFNGMSIEITAPDGTVRKFSGTRDVVQGALYTALSEIGASASYAVTAAYLRYPEIKTSASLTLTAGPVPPRIVLARPDGIVNTADAILAGNLGSYNTATGQFAFDAETNGSWMVQAYEVRPDRTHQPLGGSVAVSAADGRFQLNVGRLEPRSYRLVAKAHLVTAHGVVSDALTTSPMSLRVSDGSPVQVVLSAYREAAKIPFAASIKANVSDPTRAADIGEVIWESSADGATFAVVDRGDRYRRALGLSELIETEGSRHYRATTVNKYTGQRFVSETYRVHAYRVPKFKVSGYRYTFLDNAVTWVATTEDGAPVEYAWEVRVNNPRSDTPLLFSGDTLLLAPNQTGTWYVRLKARYEGAPDTPAAWATFDSTLAVSAPFIQAAKLSGPTNVEVGSTYSFSVDTSRVLDKRFSGDLVVRGMWRFPDGTSASAASVDYTVKSGDDQIEYVAWVEGYEQETLTVSKKRLSAWQYVWPEFVLYKRELRSFMPASTYYAINTSSYADKAGLGQELLTYTFDLPDGGEIESQLRNTALMRFSQPGTYRVVATVSDSRGNTQSIYDEVVVQPPPPLVASLSAVASDGWGRVPLDLTLRWYINGMIPNERVSKLRVYLDGDLIHEGITTYLRHKIETIGTHVLGLEIETSEGRAASSQTTFDAIEGAPPSCDISVSGDGIRALSAQGICVTLMGRLTGYHWWIEYADTGEVADLGVRGQSIYIPSSALPRGIKSITLVGVNDKGHESDPVTWSAPQKP